MESVFIAARAGTDENAAAASATVAGPHNAILRVMVMSTSLSCETLGEDWRGGERMSRGVAPGSGMVRRQAPNRGWGCAPEGDESVHTDFPMAARRTMILS